MTFCTLKTRHYISSFSQEEDEEDGPILYRDDDNMEDEGDVAVAADVAADAAAAAAVMACFSMLIYITDVDTTSDDATVANADVSKLIN